MTKCCMNQNLKKINFFIRIFLPKCILFFKHILNKILTLIKNYYE